MDPGKKVNESRKEIGRWTSEEHQRFMVAIATYGKDWKKVQQMVKTRSGSQVRSHAQKFFNKLMKQESQKKTGNKLRKNEQHFDHQMEESQNSFLRYTHEDGSNTTPLELVSLINAESQLKNQKTGSFIDNVKKKLAQKLADIPQQEHQDQLDQLKRRNSYKSMNNILDVFQNVKDPAHENQQQADQSFLLKLTKQYKRYFTKGGKFENLIDFGNPAEVDNIEKSIRKRSFTLPEGIEGTEEELNERKKRLIAEQTTAKISQQAQKMFEEAIRESRPEQKQERIEVQPEEGAQQRQEGQSQREAGCKDGSRNQSS